MNWRRDFGAGGRKIVNGGGIGNGLPLESASKGDGRTIGAGALAGT
jgi:hypothetical protein